MKYAATVLVLLTSCGVAFSQSDDKAPLPPTFEDLLVDLPTKAGASWTPPGTTSGGGAILSGRVLVTPTPANSAPVMIGLVKKKWGNLTQSEIRGALNIQDERVSIEQYDTSGKLTSLPVGASLAKGSYRVTYYYYRYQNVPCKAGDPASGGVAIGSGIRVTAEVSTLKSGVSLTGLLPLSVEAATNRVKGNLRIEAIGLASGTASISNYFSGNVSVSADGIQRAVESLGVVKAVAETPNVTISPNFLFVESNDVASCLQGLKTLVTG